MKKKKEAVREIERVLADEIRMCEAAFVDVGRVYGLALALAIITESSTDEALNAVTEQYGLAEKWDAVCAAASKRLKSARTRRLKA